MRTFQILMLSLLWIIAVHPAYGQQTQGLGVHVEVSEDPVEGVVQQISGDLVYVAGMNGSSPLWSQLAVVNGGVSPSATLEVIKELDAVLVTRVVSKPKTPIQVSDRVIRVETGNGTSGKPRRVIYATRIDKSPRLDGRLDDPAWEAAQPVRGFVQRDPDYWMPATEETVARIVYDGDKIYFGFDCGASNPEQIVANNMRRDSEIWGDDNIQILLDTYNDRQTGFFFFVNPLGAKRDLLLSDEGRTYNADWDCNWEVSTRRSEKGWTAEVAIPFDQLRFRDGETAWGINLARNLAAKNEEAQLVVGRRSASSRGRYWTAEIGELRGLEGIQTQRLVQVKPYVLPGSAKDLQAVDASLQRTFESGVDLRYGITSNLTLDLSYNTDFAQVEGDQEQVNLTQFSTFFPEKREFFLEGATLFDFGEAADTRGGGGRPPTLLFYSRRIGLENKRPVPIVLGSKMAGKAGRTSIGALSVLTDDATFRDAGGNLTVPRSNFSVLRMKQDVLARSNVGLIFVNKQTDLSGASGWGNYNRAGGVDFSYSPTPALNVQGFVARTWDSDMTKGGNAFWGRFNYQGPVWEVRAVYQDVDDFFQPEAGYVNRRSGLEAFRRYEGRVRARPRPDISNIRYISTGPEFKVFTDRRNNVKFAEVELDLWTQFNTGDWYRTEVTWERDVVD